MWNVADNSLSLSAPHEKLIFLGVFLSAPFINLNGAAVFVVRSTQPPRLRPFKPLSIFKGKGFGDRVAVILFNIDD